ncbi:hypothetical protein FRC16_005603 [Serendipita sp. 398]|nr:hypothetical protein FRC16_005603 [Serendipita sp. 398]
MPTGATNASANNSNNSAGALSASQITPTQSHHGEHRSSISTNHGDTPYRLVSTNCVQALAYPASAPACQHWPLDH